MARRGGLRGAGGIATASSIAANRERGFCPKNRSAAVVPSDRVRKKLWIAVRHARFLGRSKPRSWVSGSSCVKTYGSVIHTIFQLLVGGDLCPWSWLLR